MGNPRTKKLIVLGIRILSIQDFVDFFVLVRYLLCKISKANEFWLARYLNIYKSGRSKNKKNNSSWNTHIINVRFCGFLCIMLGYHRVKFQRLASFGWQDILIYCLNMQNYLCKSGQSKNKKNYSS